jgi:hypothetical protein
VNPSITRKELAAGFALSGACLCAGAYFSVRIPQELASTTVMRLFTLIACAIILKYTFAVGRSRGFPVRREDASIDFSNLLRNLVASAIVFLCLILVSGPIVMALVSSAR